MDGSGGKKPQHRRIKQNKVISELKKRQLFSSDVASLSREKMEAILQKAVDKEPCCRDGDCFCIRNGIRCQSDACSCWHDSHFRVKRSSNGTNNSLSIADVKKRCGNPLGTYVVDLEAIDDYRMKIIQAQPTG